MAPRIALVAAGLVPVAVGSLPKCDCQDYRNNANPSAKQFCE
eukprot:gene6799-7202_t